ncbi:MAG: 3-deoxy-7-phosphoheptulonate synthase class II [Phycisphaerales bacterium]
MMWSCQSWKSKPAHQFEYADAGHVERAIARLGHLPPLVTSWEVENLKVLLGAAQRGESFVLQGGDCAERMAECAADPVAGRIKILLQMSLVLFHATRRPVVRIGRFAGQYGKPRSSPTEVRQGPGGPVALPSYFGDLVNREAFDAESRRPDPGLMVEAYFHSAATLNFIRSLVDRGFADLHHPENWDLGMLRKAGLPPELRERYQRLCAELVAELNRADRMGERDTIQSTRAEFFTSHEGLNLHFESAMTTRVPRREGFYDLSTHLPWIGDRSRSLGGGHVEFFRGIENPVGVKLGPSARPDETLRLCEALNPRRLPGKLVLITRMGVSRVGGVLPPLVEALQREGWSARSGGEAGAGGVLWVCDPMHGNTEVVGEGSARKTRRFDAILGELGICWDLHSDLGGRLGGVHVEVTDQDVTECLGGASGVREEDLDRRYTSACDPRLNYDQAMELAFMLAERMGGPPAGQKL